MNGELKKTKAVSDELGVNPTTVQRWIKYFNIPCETNDQGHYLIAPNEIKFLKKIKKLLNEGLTMKEIYDAENINENNSEKSRRREEMLVASVFEEKLDQLMIYIEQLERKLSQSADEVVEYQVLQHRSELDQLFTMITKIDERMGKMEQHLSPLVEQKVVGGVEEPLPSKLKKSRKSKLMRIFSL